MVISKEAHFECHAILMLGKSPLKWRQRPDMTIAVDWVKHQFKQTNKQTNKKLLIFKNEKNAMFEMFSVSFHEKDPK